MAEDTLEEATDADDPKAAVISLLLETASVGEDKPHFGSAPAAAKASVSVPAPAPTIPTKHVMLSYQWDHQAQVTRVYDRLTRLGIT
eukprot:SAG11_NODE_22408_length_406_cov_1.377850_1_plen_86_part_10